MRALPYLTSYASSSKFIICVGAFAVYGLFKKRSRYIPLGHSLLFNVTGMARTNYLQNEPKRKTNTTTQTTK